VTDAQDAARPWFRAVAVADDLSDRLSLAWVVDTDVAHDLVPDACVDVVWLPDGCVQVCGPEVEGWTFHPFDGPEPVGIRFLPGHAAPVLGTAMDEIRDQRVLVEDLLGADGRRLVEELGELPDGSLPQDRIAILEKHIRRWVSGCHGVDPVAEHVATSLTADPSRRVDGLRQELDVSERQLLRRCTVAFGYGPATLRRILRLQRFLGLAGHTHTEGPDRGIAALAAEAGYADQQHLARDARAIARATPSELIRRDAPPVTLQEAT
jgi:AraC-like DNA-binding protein